MRTYNIGSIAKGREINNAFVKLAAFAFFRSFADIVFMFKNSSSGPTPLSVTVF